MTRRRTIGLHGEQEFLLDILAINRSTLLSNLKQRKTKRAGLYEDLSTILLLRAKEGLKPDLESISERIGITSSVLEHQLRATKNGGELIAHNILPKARTMRLECIDPGEDSKYAWFLGATAGDGYVGRSQVTITVTSKQFRDKYAEIGEQLFGLEASLDSSKLSRKNPRWNDVHTAYFTSVDLCEMLGDLRAQAWPHTLNAKHSWIYQEPKYIWKFLQGYFDAEGSVCPVDRKPRIRYAVAYKEVAHYLGKVLELVGLESRIETNREKRDGIGGISIAQHRHMKQFALNVNSCIPAKEQRLKQYRNAELHSGVPANITCGYKRAMLLRSTYGWGASRIAQDPHMRHWSIKPSTIRNWIHSGNDPRRHNIYNAFK